MGRAEAQGTCRLLGCAAGLVKGQARPDARSLRLMWLPTRVGRYVLRKLRPTTPSNSVRGVNWVDCRLDSIAHFELPQHLPNVLVDRVGRYEKPLSDLAVGE